jgi:hypothetical protein
VEATVIFTSTAETGRTEAESTLESSESDIIAVVVAMEAVEAIVASAIGVGRTASTFKICIFKSLGG